MITDRFRALDAPLPDHWLIEDMGFETWDDVAEHVELVTDPGDRVSDDHESLESDVYLLVEAIASSSDPIVASAGKAVLDVL